MGNKFYYSLVTTFLEIKIERKLEFSHSQKLIFMEKSPKSQPAFTCLESAVDTPEQFMKSVQSSQ